MWLIFTDLHLAEYRPFATVNEKGINTRLVMQAEVVKSIKLLCRKYKVSTIFFLGDLFHSQSPTISKIVYNMAFYLIQSLADICTVYMLTGNHDIFVNIHIFTPFSSIPNVNIINSTAQIELDGKHIELVPWGGTLRFPDKMADYLFGHFGMVGGIPASQEIDVPVAILKDYKLVMAGHYHTRRQMADNAFHIGAVMANSFSDTPEDRGVWLLNPTNSEYRFIPIKSPKFKTFEFDSSSQIEAFYKDMYNTTDYFKLILKGDDWIIPEQQANVKIEYDIDPKSESELILTDPADIVNLQSIITDFIENSNTSLDKSTLKEKAVELLNL